MKKDIEQLDTCIIKVFRDGNHYIGCKISNSSRPDTFAVENRETDSCGYVWDGATVSDLITVGSIEYEGRYQLFPDMKIQTFHMLLDKKLPEIVPYLSKLSAAAKAVKNKTGAMPHIQTNSVFFTDDGRVIILAGNTLERFRSCHRDSERVACSQLFNDSSREDDSVFFYFMSAIIYKLISGATPFSGKTAGEIRDAVHKQRFIPLQYLTPEIMPDISESIDSCLKGGTIDFETLDRIIAAIETGSWKEKISIDQKSILLEKGYKLQNWQNRRTHMEAFFRKYRFTLAVVGILVFIAGSITYSMVAKALAPPITVGMTSREVVELFYYSMNTFDHFSMEDTITKEAGKDYINEAVNLYAFSKMRQSYDVGQTPFVDVQEWVDAGRPVLPIGKSVYGIANLSITEESPNVFIVEYEKWVEDDIEEGNGKVTVHYTGLRRKDRCTLEMQKYAWIITKLERLSETDISDK